MVRVFVSSSAQDSQHRQAVTEVIANMRPFENVWSVSPGVDLAEPNVVASLRSEIAATDLLVIILGPPKGRIQQRPAVPDEQEYLSSLAVEAGKPVFLFVHKKSVMDLSRYKAKV